MPAMFQFLDIDLYGIALDIQFNAAVLTICKRLLPAGYDISPDAPSTYEELMARLDAGKRMLVYSGGSERTIYGDPEVNYAFRAWHDWCHWRGRHDFSLEGERAACAMQGRHVVDLYGDTPQTCEFRRIPATDSDFIPAGVPI